METNEQHLFSGPEYQLAQASSGKRFANYIIDLIIYYLLWFIFGMVMALLSPGTIEELTEEPGFDLIDRLLTLLLYGLYMFVIEAVFKGKSIGKYITGTRAVNNDGSHITVSTALWRGLSRAVPFNAFSALGSPCYPWHDKWSRTYVIDEKESNYPGSV